MRYYFLKSLFAVFALMLLSCTTEKKLLIDRFYIGQSFESATMAAASGHEELVCTKFSDVDVIVCEVKHINNKNYYDIELQFRNDVIDKISGRINRRNEKYICSKFDMFVGSKKVDGKGYIWSTDSIVSSMFCEKDLCEFILFSKYL